MKLVYLTILMMEKRSSGVILTLQKRQTRYFDLIKNHSFNFHLSYFVLQLEKKLPFSKKDKKTNELELIGLECTCETVILQQRMEV